MSCSGNARDSKPHDVGPVDERRSDVHSTDTGATTPQPPTVRYIISGSIANAAELSDASGSVSITFDRPIAWQETSKQRAPIARNGHFSTDLDYLLYDPRGPKRTSDTRILLTIKCAGALPIELHLDLLAATPCQSADSRPTKAIELSVTVRPAGMATGRVADPAGSAKSGALVMCMEPPESERAYGEMSRTTTAHDGTFAISIPASDSALLLVLARDFQPRAVRIGAGHLPTLALGELVVDKGLRLSGRMGNNQHSGMSITATLAPATGDRPLTISGWIPGITFSGDTPYVASATGDVAHGDFAIEGVSARSYYLWVTGTARASCAFGPQVGMVKYLAPKDDIELTDPRARIAFSVSSVDGPVDGAIVQPLVGNEPAGVCLSDHTGGVDWMVPPIAPMRFRISRAGYVPQEVSTISPAAGETQDMSVRLTSVEGSGSVVLSVSSGGPPSPVKDILVDVRMLERSGQMSRVKSAILHSESGFYTLDGLPRSSVVISVDPHGVWNRFEPMLQRQEISVMPQAGEPQVTEVRLKAGGMIKCITGSSGRQYQGCALDLRDGVGTAFSVCAIDDTDRYGAQFPSQIPPFDVFILTPALEPGQYYLAVDWKGQRKELGQILVVAGEYSVIELR